jgi:hypothetical protein
MIGYIKCYLQVVCDIAIDVHAPNEDICDDKKDSFLSDMKILLEIFQ